MAFQINLDYAPSVNNIPRWTCSNPNHFVEKALNKYDNNYTNYCRLLDKYAANLVKSVPCQSKKSCDPSWVNYFLAGVDALALYAMFGFHKPMLYIEVGSGNSTKFARKAINDFSLKTKITSIDPYPRSEIDSICDEIIRQPFELVDLSIFDHLVSNDIIFIDNSHRCFMNSDVTAVFMDLMPRIPHGVLLHIHDIFLPFDYPLEWVDRYYSEQYLLGAMLANSTMDSWDILFPATYICASPIYGEKLEEYFSDFRSVDSFTWQGCSFWMRKI